MATEQYDEAGRYADDILNDWIKNENMTAESLRDITDYYIRILRFAADNLPKRMSLPLGSQFERQTVSDVVVSDEIRLLSA